MGGEEGTRERSESRAAMGWAATMLQILPFIHVRVPERAVGCATAIQSACVGAAVEVGVGVVELEVELELGIANQFENMEGRWDDDNDRCGRMHARLAEWNGSLWSSILLHGPCGPVEADTKGNVDSVKAKGAEVAKGV